MTLIKIGIAGCLGRMGKEIQAEIKKDARLQYVGGFDKQKNIKTLRSNIFKESDVIIDFSTPTSSVNNAVYANSFFGKKIALVVGTTGLNKLQQKKIELASKKVPILFSSNMSLGVNLLFELVKKSASKLNSLDYDIEIAETHHKHKVDAPSGTALSLGEHAAQGRKVNFSSVKVLDRTGKFTKRKNSQIGFSVTRGGEIAGEHTVSFIGDNDRIDITHKANNRLIFVRGAIEAAIFMYKKKPGLYSINDMIKF